MRFHHPLCSSVFFIIFLAACGPSKEVQATLTASAVTATAAAWTLTPTITATTTPSPTPTSTPTLTPSPTATLTFTPTPEVGRFTVKDGSISFVPPPGWKPRDIGLDYPGLFAAAVGAAEPGLTFFRVEVAFPMAFYSAVFQDSLREKYKTIKTTREDFLSTSAGSEYFRWEFEQVINGRKYHEVLYFFEAGDKKLIVTYTRAVDRGQEYDAQVDEAMNTMHFSG
jgi:hypothetical protein